jgi:hypothetical protein
MKTTFYSVIASTFLLASTGAKAATCSPSLNEQLARNQHIVDTLKPDKPGQVRVSAFDGSEYTAGEALWMKGQLRSVLKACQRQDEASATSILDAVTQLLDSHHRAL